MPSPYCRNPATGDTNFGVLPPPNPKQPQLRPRGTICIAYSNGRYALDPPQRLVHAEHEILIFLYIKVYDKPEEGTERYSPGNFVTVEKSVQRGNPDLERACTSHAERKNGSLCQWCRRLPLGPGAD
jgi:hypothetical protein